ncbi:MAG: pilus assembly protein TadG-related protein [Bacillota bacterium]
MRNLRTLLEDQRGNALVLVAAGMVALLGFTAITLDGGAIYATRARAQTAADAAALAAAQFLPTNPGMADAAARDIAFRNNMDPSFTRVDISSDGGSVQVASGRTVNLGLARVLGFASAQQGAVATAKVGTAGAVKGIAPLGVPASEFQPGVSYTLKDSKPNSPGNFFALALGGRGSSNYEENLKNGYPARTEVGDMLWTETGDKTGGTRDAIRWILDNFSSDSDGNGIVDDQQDLNSDGYPDLPADTRRVVIIPIVDDFPNGRDQVQVVGFAAFYIEGFGNGQDSITGRFIRYVLDAEISSTAPDYGARVVRLTQ